MQPAEIQALETQITSISEETKESTLMQKSLVTELTKIRGSPRDSELDTEIAQMEQDVNSLDSLLIPLREGSALVSDEDILILEKDWNRWKSEWIARKKVFKLAWALVADSLPPNEAIELAEDLGIEFDSPEHQQLEKNMLCSKPRFKG